jgi:hypothetical protein
MDTFLLLDDIEEKDLAKLAQLGKAILDDPAKKLEMKNVLEALVDNMMRKQGKEPK